MAVVVEIAGSDLGPTRPGIGAQGPAADQGAPVHVPDRALAAARVLPKDVAGYRRRRRRRALRHKAAAGDLEHRAVVVRPPAEVVPKRSPSASQIRPAVGVPPSAPLKLTSVVGALAYPAAVFLISNTVPLPFVPPPEVVPKRSPLPSAIGPANGAEPFVPLRLTSVVGVVA